MENQLTGNVLVAQSGGPTSVINASLAGVITESLNHDCIEEIYGGLNGIEGILKEQLIDLAEESQQTVRGLRYTPSSALGTCRYKLKSEEDFARVIEVFKVVGLAEKYPRGYIARYERKVGTVVSVEHQFRTGGSYGRNKRIIVVRMASEEPVGGAVYFILYYDVGIVDMCKAYCGSEAEQRTDSCPVAHADGYAVWILAVEVPNILRVFLYIRTQFVAVVFVHVRYGIECGLKSEF